ncbi:NUDIX hydrolase [filamentous cyanobacterium LEGE 11480]|uniref:NUDIX hydrolase n=1 Tax=Romeriopsis navalis LEGE 11480 TaxID=2777977 RepID=A0A928VH83_9CYAN|nr:NUDIX hydrolase [Romeriopsis navalis]MBE9028566.1 NUDIX hydrolase [Romeriopsis navalis LEGE 11480]
MASAPVEVAICILHQTDQFLMQLRDNDPKILYPGYWGLFGGHIEAGESPEVAVVREVLEEISYQLPSYEKFGIYGDEKVVRHVFHAPLNVGLEQLVLGEGWDMGLLAIEQIRSGTHYSSIAQQARPVGPIHQTILSDFYAQYRSLS